MCGEMHDTTVQQPLTTVSPNSNQNIMMLQAEVGFVSKQVVSFRCPCPLIITPLATQTLVVTSQSQTKQWTPCGHSTMLQTASNETSGHRMMHNRLNL
ncbi:hypothetical protein TNCV_3592731 [Trichonephila clavipes]|nr:hypothetical protein TNCV_3592731 [Trichonephila clavipes]